MNTEDIPGWMTPRELDTLRELAGQYKRRIQWVEVGVWCGRSAHAVGLALPPKSTLYLIDDYTSTLSGYLVDPPAIKRVMDVISDLMKRRPDIVIVPIQLSSLTAATLFATIGRDPVDVVFVDADHSLEAVKADCLAWENVTKRLLGHDYNPKDNPEVIAAVHEVYGDKIKVFPETTIWEVIR
jgi:hypothetical protein